MVTTNPVKATWGRGCVRTLKGGASSRRLTENTWSKELTRRSRRTCPPRKCSLASVHHRVSVCQGVTCPPRLLMPRDRLPKLMAQLRLCPPPNPSVESGSAPSKDLTSLTQLCKPEMSVQTWLAERQPATSRTARNSSKPTRALR